MAGANPNDAGMAARRDLVNIIISQLFGGIPGTEAVSIKPLAYEAGFPYHYNNFVFKVSLRDLQRVPEIAGQSPGTIPIPQGTEHFVLRFPNPEYGYNDEVRVENEVAALNLAREALASRNYSNLIPQIYAWYSAKDGHQGWILMEFKSGTVLSDDFPSMDPAKQANLLNQMADILQCLQQFRLPDTIKGFGGLAFNGNGDIITGPMSTMKSGPFETYEELVLATITEKLEEADKHDRIQGWRQTDIRSRLDKFLSTKLPILISQFPARHTPTLVHADFSTDNVLYSPTTERLTAVLDFDVSHVGTVADDFLRSLGHHAVGRLPDAREGGDATRALRRAMLHGFPDPLPPPSGGGGGSSTTTTTTTTTTTEEDVDWKAAKAWDDALRARGMRRPGNMAGIDGLSGLFWLSAQLMPWKLTNPVVVRESEEEQLVGRMKSTQESLDRFLTEHGC